MVNRNNICIVFVLVFCFVHATRAMEKSNTHTSAPISLGALLLEIVLINGQDTVSPYLKFKNGRNPENLIQEIRTFLRSKQVCKSTYAYFTFPWIQWKDETKNEVMNKYSVLWLTSSSYIRYRVILLALIYSGGAARRGLSCAIRFDHHSDVEWLINYEQTLKKPINFDESYCCASSQIIPLLHEVMRNDAAQVELFGEAVLKQLMCKDSTKKERKQLIAHSIRKQCRVNALCPYHTSQEHYYIGFYSGYHNDHS
jgi:hypothetical protein